MCFGKNVLYFPTSPNLCLCTTWGNRHTDHLAGCSVSAAVNLPLHHKVQKFSSGTGSPGWYRIKGHKRVVVVVVTNHVIFFLILRARPVFHTAELRAFLFGTWIQPYGGPPLSASKLLLFQLFSGRISGLATCSLSIQTE